MKSYGTGGRRSDLIEALESRRLLSAATQGVLPSISIADAQTAEGDRGVHGVSIVVGLSQASSRAVSVGFRTVDGSAVGGSDYLGRSGTIVFRPGQTSRTIKINVRGDAVQEADEDFLVVLKGARGGTIDGEAGSSIVTITNDDSANPARPAVLVADAVFSEANDGSGFKNNYFFPIELSAPTDHDVTISYHSTDVTAKAAKDLMGVEGDYDSLAGSVTIPAGQTTAIIPVQIINDGTQEPTRTFALHVTNVQGAVLAGNVARRNLTGVILDNDGITTGPTTLYYGQDWGQNLVPQTVGQRGLHEELNRINAGLLDGGAVKVQANQVVVVPPVQLQGSLLLANTGGPPVAIVSGTYDSLAAVASGQLHVQAGVASSGSELTISGGSVIVNYAAVDTSATNVAIRSLLNAGADASYTRVGTGTLMLTGTNLTGPVVNVAGGTLNLVSSGTGPTSGALNLNGTSGGYSGAATINGGVINASGGTLTLAGGGTVSATADPTIGAVRLTGSGSVNIAGGDTLTVTQGAIPNAGGGTVSIGSGTLSGAILVFSSGGTLSAGGGISGGTLVVNGGGTLSGGTVLTGGSSFVGIDTLTTGDGTIDISSLLLDSTAPTSGNGTTSTSSGSTDANSSGGSDSATDPSTTTPLGSNLLLNAAMGVALAAGSGLRPLLSRLNRRRRARRRL